MLLQTDVEGHPAQISAGIKKSLPEMGDGGVFSLCKQALRW